jgi:hypothetical protein
VNKQELGRCGGTDIVGDVSDENLSFSFCKAHIHNHHKSKLLKHENPTNSHMLYHNTPISHSSAGPKRMN